MDRNDLGRHEYDWPNLSNLNFFIFEFLSPNKNQKDPAISSDNITDYKNLKLELQKSLQFILLSFNPLSANLTKWSNTLKQFVGKLPTNCLSVFDHFVRLTLKELTYIFADNKCLVSYATLKAPIVCCTKKELPEFWWENRHPRLCKWKSLDGLPEDSWALFSWKKQLFRTFLKTVRTYKSTSSFSKVTIKSAVMESATLSMKFCTIGKESERISWRAHSSRRSYGDQKKTGQRRICWFYSFK